MRHTTIARPVPPCPQSFRGRLGDFLDTHVAPALPSVESSVDWHRAVTSWAQSDAPFLVIRKCAEFPDRGRRYETHRLSFTVSDNEAALCVFMFCFDGAEPFDLTAHLRDERIPIAYVPTVAEVAAAGRRWKTTGRVPRASVFAKAGWKHCHLFDAAPRGMRIADANELRRRAICLLSPFNHVPMPSPRHYTMAEAPRGDWGESPDVLDFITAWMRRRLASDATAVRAFDELLATLARRAVPVVREPHIAFVAKEPGRIITLEPPPPGELPTEYVSSDDSAASFEPGENVGDVNGLIERLRRWIEETDEDLIGNSPKYRGKAWVRFSIASIRCHLNSDTNRKGVAEFLRRASRPHLVISVGRSDKGRITKLLFAGQAIPRFAAYTDDVQSRPRILWRDTLAADRRA